MSASFGKLYRQAHRNLRLGQFHPGEPGQTEVRPLALTTPTDRLIKIKAPNLIKKNESKS